VKVSVDKEMEEKRRGIEGQEGELKQIQVTV
jgi:hypothetical protein